MVALVDVASSSLVSQPTFYRPAKCSPRTWLTYSRRAKGHRRDPFNPLTQTAKTRRKEREADPLISEKWLEEAPKCRFPA